MKKIIFLLIVIAFSGCDSENAIDCFQKAGKSTTKVYDLPAFDEIMTYSRVKLYITDGPTQKVMVKTGENLLDEIKFAVKDNRLEIKNENGCNLVRDYELTEVYVTSPNLTYLKNGSQFVIESTDTLHYPNLELVSNDNGQEDEYHTDGDFKLQLDCNKLKINNSNLSNYFLSGKTRNFNINIFNGDCRIEAQNLKAQNIQIFDRGTQDVILNPRQSITGKIVSTGDVILVNRPSIVDVEVLYKGDLIFP